MKPSGVMELITVLLSSFLSVLSFGGIVADQAAANAIRSRFSKVENIQVRIDNAPNLQIINGKADRVRVAAQGLWLNPSVRIDGFELETDPIQVDPQKIQQLSQLKFESLPQPLQAGVKFTLDEQDINKSLKSTAVLNQLQKVVSDSIAAFGGSAGITYKVENPQVRFLPSNRLGMKFTLVDTSKPVDKLNLDIETGVKIMGGRRIQLENAQGSVNRMPLPGFVLEGLISSINERADLAVLENRGLLARVLNVKVTNKKMAVATFVRFQVPPAQRPR
jgi:LmeA-like phospholipid-binding